MLSPLGRGSGGLIKLDIDLSILGSGQSLSRRETPYDINPGAGLKWFRTGLGLFWMVLGHFGSIGGWFRVGFKMVLEWFEGGLRFEEIYGYVGGCLGLLLGC